MSAVKTSIDLAVTPEQLWEILMDPTRLGEWVSIHRKIEGVPALPLIEGSTFQQTLHLAGTNFKVRWKVDELQAPTFARWLGDGPARAKAVVEYRVEPRSDGTSHFEYSNEFHPPGGPLGALAGRVLIGGISEREATRSLKGLKTFVEGDRCERRTEKKK